MKEKLIFKNQYFVQRVKNAYVASICQSEVFFYLAHAVQSIDFLSDNITSLNKRLQWQIDHRSKKLKYVQLNEKSLRLMIFTDFFFVNNRDLFSQIDYVACLTDSTDTVNILHWSFIKCKQVIRSVFVFELYALIYEFDLKTVLKTTISKALESNVLLVICTDNKSLYNCLVKLETTNKKRLMIDVMSFRQSYKKREITEMRWIKKKKQSDRFDDQDQALFDPQNLDWHQ